MTEKDILNATLIFASQLPGQICRLFRNNIVFSWVGNVVSDEVRKGERWVTIRDARPVRAGLAVGSPDLVGWTTVEITPEMIGRKVAVFSGAEVKQPGAKPSEEQVRFLTAIQEAGGIAGIVQNPEEYGELVRNFGAGADPAPLPMGKKRGRKPKVSDVTDQEETA